MLRETDQRAAAIGIAGVSIALAIFGSTLLTIVVVQELPWQPAAFGMAVIVFAAFRIFQSSGWLADDPDEPRTLDADAAKPPETYAEIASPRTRQTYTGGARAVDYGDEKMFEG